MPGGMVMTTGLLADASFFRGTLDKLKIQPEMEHIGAYKSASEQWTRDTMSEAQRTVTNSILDGLYDQFVEGIASSRKLTAREVRAAIDKGMLTPEEAKEAKLVDEPPLRRPGRGRAQEALRQLLGGQDPQLQEGGRLAVRRADRRAQSERRDRVGPQRQRRLRRRVHRLGNSLAHAPRGARGERRPGRHPRVDSPGGSGVASDAIWRETRLYREANRPLIVSMGDVAGSGGYYIAMAADSIVAEPATITGSIGVISGKFNMRGLYEDWLGIHRDQIKRGENADLFSDYTGYTDEQRAIVRRQMESFYKDFVHKAGGRAREEGPGDRPRGTGPDLDRRAGEEIGLIDELGGLRRAIEIAKSKAGIGPATA
jgi:protease-4